MCFSEELDIEMMRKEPEYDEVKSTEEIKDEPAEREHKRGRPKKLN